MNFSNKNYHGDVQVTNDKFEYSHVESGLIRTGSDALLDVVTADVQQPLSKRLSSDQLALAYPPTFMKNSHESVYEKSVEFENNNLKKTENVEKALYDFVIDEHFSDTDSSSC